MAALSPNANTSLPAGRDAIPINTAKPSGRNTTPWQPQPLMIPRKGRIAMPTTAMKRARHPITAGEAGRPSDTRTFDMERVDVQLIGAANELFKVSRDGEYVNLQPTRGLPVRCTVRPVAIFESDHGWPECNTVMGRLLFQPGDSQPQCYRPFTFDERRQLRRLLLIAEQTPNDDLYASRDRWHNWQMAASELLDRCQIGWPGLSPLDVSNLLDLEPWQQPVEGCVLHALTQWSHQPGQCIVEVGSLRGQSTSMLAMALRGIDSDNALVSVDPHSQQPLNEDQVRLTLAQIGERHRLVQIGRRSDEAAALLRPASASTVFVDGDHGYDQVQRDFRSYAEILSPGGCLLFHDYGYGSHNGKADVVPDVRPAIDELLGSMPEFRPLLLAHTLLALVKQSR